MVTTIGQPIDCPVDHLRVPLSLTILIASPIRTDLPLSPVGAFLIPLISSNVFLGSLVVSGINLFIQFLFKCQLVSPPCYPPPASDLARVTLTLPQLTELMKAYSRGQSIEPYLKRPGDDTGPFGGDEPLFPDNLSVSLVLAAPFADFDGSPDTNFNVPLFEVPGLQGGLIIALLILIARFILELGGLAFVRPEDPPNPSMDILLRQLINLKGGR
ncbi:MAG TPA: hypothetical protein VFF14_11530 [Candidatus Deferrimicrobium sp.]|nr:hypothetical protein [Candidatus Deferrimicrobium sp.]